MDGCKPLGAGADMFAAQKIQVEKDAKVARCRCRLTLSNSRSKRLKLTA